MGFPLLDTRLLPLFTLTRWKFSICRFRGPRSTGAYALLLDLTTSPLPGFHLPSSVLLSVLRWNGSDELGSGS